MARASCASPIHPLIQAVKVVRSSEQLCRADSRRRLCLENEACRDSTNTDRRLRLLVLHNSRATYLRLCLLFLMQACR